MNQRKGKQHSQNVKRQKNVRKGDGVRRLWRRPAPLNKTHTCVENFGDKPDDVELSVSEHVWLHVPCPETAWLRTLTQRGPHQKASPCVKWRETRTPGVRKGKEGGSKKKQTKGTDPPLMGGSNGIAKIFSAKSEESRRFPSMPVWRITGSIACYETNILRIYVILLVKSSQVDYQYRRPSRTKVRDGD